MKYFNEQETDLRSDSETYGKWFGIELTEENKKQFYIITSVLFFLVAKVITHKSRVTK